jgi:hypothetical protein
MLTANTVSLVLALGLCTAVFASPALAQSRQDQRHVTATRSVVMQECNREAEQDFPWYEDMNRAAAYKACMMSHGQPELF